MLSGRNVLEPVSQGHLCMAWYQIMLKGMMIIIIIISTTTIIIIMIWCRVSHAVKFKKGSYFGLAIQVVGLCCGAPGRVACSISTCSGPWYPPQVDSPDCLQTLPRFP